MSSILDQIRSGAGKAAFEAEKLRKVTAIRSEIRSLKNDVEEALLRAGQVAFQLHQSNAVTQPQLQEACARVDALQAQIAAREREIERVQSETYQEPKAGPQYGHLCPNGHGELPAGARFCPECGAEGIYVSPPVGTSCSECGAAIPPEAQFCPSCGTPVPGPATDSPVSPAGTTCPTCGTPLVSGARFCPECGTPVPTSTTPPHGESQPQTTHGESPVAVPSSPAQPESDAQSQEEASVSSETTVEDQDVCPNCGAALVSDAIFCPDCGHRLEESSVAEPGTVAQDESTTQWESQSPEETDDDGADTWRW